MSLIIIADWILCGVIDIQYLIAKAVGCVGSKPDSNAAQLHISSEPNLN